MNAFISGLLAAALLATAAGLVLDLGVQQSSEVAYATSAARP